MAKLWHDNGTFILRDDWHVEDILCEAEAKEVQISHDQAVQVMHYIVNTFDANIGVNWDVISNAIDEILHEETLRNEQ